MTREVVEPRIRGFVCLTAHPDGCAKEVAWQSDVARQADVARQVDGARQAEVARRSASSGGGNLLVVGASTGYGLSSRIAGTFGQGMDSVGVFLERPASARRTASPGWYNTAAFHDLAEAAGRQAFHVNGDAFSTEVLDATLDLIETRLGPIDVFVYSVAAPRRTDPDTGITHESVLKTVGEPFQIKTVDDKSLEVRDTAIEPATPEEVAGTVAVMGGADLARWSHALRDRNLLARDARIVAYSYIGPEVTWPIYRDGTIGQAKHDLERTMSALNDLVSPGGGSANVSINKSIVTQASAAIPGVPLYMSLVFRVMKDAGLHEGPIEQMVRLFNEHIGTGGAPSTDGEGRIRLDDLEMRPEIQAETIRRWKQVNTENLMEISDYAGYQRYFRRLFGFERDDVDYSEPVETEVEIPGVVEPGA